MTAWEVVKTIFGYYRNWEKEAGFQPSVQMWIPKDIIQKDIREQDSNTNQIIENGENQVTEIKKIPEKNIENINVEQKDIFEDIIGHELLKLIFNNALTSNEQVHILLTGTPGSAKSLFLESISDNVKQSYFINNNSTGAGIIFYLYDHPELKFLLIDEIEKLKREELSVLLSIMENQRLVITKKTMTCNRKQKLTVFATCNNKNKLAPEMLSRFLQFHLKEYSQEEFIMIANNIVTARFNKTQEFAQKLALAVWHKMNSKDIRDVIKVARLAKKDEDMDMVIEAIQEYKDDK